MLDKPPSFCERNGNLCGWIVLGAAVLLVLFALSLNVT